MVLISGPVIAKLALRTRKGAHEHMRRGSFGPLTVDSCGVLFADLAAVERRLGGPITRAQLDRATWSGRSASGMICLLTSRCPCRCREFLRDTAWGWNSSQSTS